MQGFTLIEILVVVFIIGLTAGVVALSMGDRKDETGPKKETQVLIQAIDFAGEYAALNNELVGLFVSTKEAEEAPGQTQWCYSWQRLRDNAWVDFSEGVLVEHCMDPSLQWDLVIEGKVYEYDPDLEKHPPLLVFSYSGETTPAEMAIYEQDKSTEAQHLELDMMGNRHWRNQEEENKNRAP